MTSKLTITAIGEPKVVKTKFGDKQKSYIKATEYPDKFLNYWLGEGTKDWAIGKVVEVESVDKRDYTATDGTLKTSYEIKLPRSGFGELIKRIETLENDVTKLKLHVDALNRDNEHKVPYPEYQGDADFDKPSAGDEPPF